MLHGYTIGLISVSTTKDRPFSEEDMNKGTCYMARMLLEIVSCPSVIGASCVCWPLELAECEAIVPLHTYVDSVHRPACGLSFQTLHACAGLCWLGLCFRHTFREQ